jgi:diguanylate cyclase (GGDEF)-like protein/PAS domain S-box-containing protein
MTDPGALEQQLLEYKAILDNAGVAVVFTRDRHVYRCNPYAEALFDWPAGTLVGKPGMVFYASPEVYKVFRQKIRPVLNAGETVDTETFLARRGGSTFNAHVIARAINPANPRAGTIWIVRDISQAVSTRESNARLLREQQLIFAGAQIGILFSRNRIILRCNPRFEELLGYATNELIGQSTRIYYESEESWKDIGDRAYGAITRHGVFNGEERYIRRDGTPFWCRVTGSMLDPANPGEGYVWLYEDITEKRRVLTTMDALLREQTLIFERAQIGIMFIRNGVILRCNPRFEEIFGHPKNSLTGKSNRILFPDETTWSATVERVYSALALSGSFEGDIDYCRGDGTPICCHAIGRYLEEGHPEAGYVWLYEDITARRAAEIALLESNQEYSLIFDNAMIGISYMHDRVFLRCNRRLEEIFGFPPGGLLGKSSRLLFDSEQEWEETGRRVYSATKSGDFFSGEIRYRRADGQQICVNARGRVVERNGEQIWIWTHQDVTRRYRAEEALRKSNLELEQRVAERTSELSQQLHFQQQLIETIPGPIFYKDANARYLGCNSAFANFIGIAADKLLGMAPHDIAPPELADKYLAADLALFNQPGVQIYESPVRYASGEMRDVLFHKATFTEADGSVGGLVGFMLDITERKRMEERLQQAATVFDSSAEGFTITAPDGTIIAVNRAFTEITGYSEEEAVGRKPSMLQSGRHSEEFYREMWTTIEFTGRWQGEVWNKCKDGRIFPEWLTISAVKDTAGKLTHYVGVFSDITAIKTAYDQISHLAHHDALTGLPNRLLLEDRLHVAIQRARREETGLAVLFVDLDRFKTINDSLGHHVGDRVLCEVSARFSKLIRESDTVARLGGDEFLILVEGFEDSAVASTIAEKILNNLRDTPVSLEQEFFIGVSIGISLFPQDGNDSAALIKNADIAMYRAKERGRNTYELFTQELNHSSLDRFQMETDLRRAVERDELQLYLQPQFSLKTGQLIGAEALLRWQHPIDGLILPGKFIPLAEESGLILAVGEWVQQTACQHWAGWVKSGLNPGVLSINVSGVEFRRGRIQETVRKALESTRLPPALLELEITESAVMLHAESSIQVLNDLRAMGISLAIDDFGTGYSSLAYLKRLPLDKLKVDQSFVRGLPDDAEDCAIARAVIALGHSLQLTIIAEGVETQEQSDFLAREGCDEMQGYLRGKPMPADEFRQQFLKP